MAGSTQSYKLASFRGATEARSHATRILHGGRKVAASIIPHKKVDLQQGPPLRISTSASDRSREVLQQEKKAAALWAAAELVSRLAECRRQALLDCGVGILRQRLRPSMQSSSIRYVKPSP